MKTINKFLLTALMGVFSVGTASAQCPTSIIATSFGSGAFSFSANAGASGSNYVWDFGDGNTSTQQTVNQYQYSSPGAYLVCLTIDSCATICDSVVYGNSTPCSITSGFTYSDNGSGNFSFTNTSTGSGLSYSWNFGDGNTSTAMNPNHTYSSNGTYAVGLFINNSIAGCYDYYYTTFQVSGISSPTSCNASFVIIPDSASLQGTGSGNGIIVFNTSTGTGLNYFWNFGDGTTSTQQFPNHTYSGSGPYYLCLTVDDGGTCTSTYCDSIGSNGIVFKGAAGFDVNVQAPTITGVNTFDKVSDVSIFPNPVKNNVAIKFDLLKSSVVEVFVTDLLGNKIEIIVNKTMASGINSFNYNVSNISNGIYLLTIKTGDSLQVEKIVVNK